MTSTEIENPTSCMARVWLYGTVGKSISSECSAVLASLMSHNSQALAANSPVCAELSVHGDKVLPCPVITANKFREIYKCMSGMNAWTGLSKSATRTEQAQNAEIAAGRAWIVPVLKERIRQLICAEGRMAYCRQPCLSQTSLNCTYFIVLFGPPLRSL